MSYCAGWPAPLLTSVNDSETDVSVAAETVRSLTVPGFDTTGADTVIAAVPVLPSLVAVIVAAPAARLVSRPALLTPATAGALDVQVTLRPVKTLPAASFRTALSCCVVPATWLTVAGVTTTDATGATAGALVVPLATLESAPNTALTLSVPRNATSRN